MYFGRVLEPVIAQRFMEETGLKVVNDNKIRFHKEHSFLIANIDRLILANGDYNRGILEIKTTNSFNVKTWEYEIPLDYYAQLQHYLNVLDLEYGFIALLIDGRNYKHIIFKRDDAFIQSMQETLINFWQNNVLKQIPPEPQNSEDITKIYEPTPDKNFETDLIDFKLSRDRIIELKAQKARIEKNIEAYEEKIKFAMKDAESISYLGEILATWKETTTNRFDSKNFSKAHPELSEAFTTQTKSRRFLIKNSEV